MSVIDRALIAQRVALYRSINEAAVSEDASLARKLLALFALWSMRRLHSLISRAEAIQQQYHALK